MANNKLTAYQIGHLATPRKFPPDTRKGARRTRRHKAAGELDSQLAAYAWNIPQPLTQWGKASVAMQVMLHASPKLKKLLPADWFNFAFAWRHANKRQKIALKKLLRRNPHYANHTYPHHLTLP
jgi:ABC-type uncharacterized transport system YnjBCD ATPase subunit